MSRGKGLNLILNDITCSKDTINKISRQISFQYTIISNVMSFYSKLYYSVNKLLTDDIEKRGGKGLILSSDSRPTNRKPAVQSSSIRCRAIVRDRQIGIVIPCVSGICCWPIAIDCAITLADDHDAFHSFVLLLLPQ